MEREMKVRKRDGKLENISFDKILKRVKSIGQECKIKLNFTSFVMKVIDQLYDGISTTQIDELTAEQCASLSIQHNDYNTLASHITVSNHHKNTDSSFFSVMEKLYNFHDIHNKHYPLISKDLFDIISQFSSEFENMIVNNRDYLIDYFGFKTLERAYLMKYNGKPIERPQHLWLRVAIGIHGNNIEKVKTTYDLMSQKYFTHATPTLFNAGTPKPQLSSCYLIALEDDSISGIYNTLKDCAQISKYSGGIGLHIHNIRAAGSHIRGTNGNTDGLIPMLRVYNATARYVNQGGKRNGSFAIYLEPWHADIENFLEMRKNHGDEEMKARDLFYALWISDLFMERVSTNDKWTLMCPDECPGLSDVYGDKFKELYCKYESENKGKKTINARDLWFQILDSQMETGTPYLLFKDAANNKSNQQNLGTIKSSNLCTEIIEYSDSTETAVCNLASIGLPMFVNEDKSFNYDKLHQVAKVVTDNLNKVIDINFYPTEKTHKSNMRHRPIGIGVQGLADVFALMDISFTSDAAREVNKFIFETIYHAAVEQSMEIAKERYTLIQNAKRDGRYENNGILSILNKFEYHLETNKYCGAYSTFEGSPMSKGTFQFDMWNVTPSNRYDWFILKEQVKKYGIRNSLLVAPMPTASTAQILGNNECFEPFTSNIYTRRTLAGEFIIVNKYLMKELIDLKIWSDDVRKSIIANNGSVQQIIGIPQHIKDKYKIVWEIPMKTLIDMAADRGAFICQSQSLNLWMEEPNYKTLTSMHFYSWKAGLKTGIYYLRRKAKHQAQQFTIEPDKKNDVNTDEPEICEMCSA
jgi:ribonucleotide reductase alpha subunit|uniref:ribonucleoside-diphosphate reductase n=1 Tax=viral metagenome TaxID=1070528 RepID=A0A6C0CL30_9ZZZZ